MIPISTSMLFDWFAFEMFEVKEKPFFSWNLFILLWNDVWTVAEISFYEFIQNFDLSLSLKYGVWKKSTGRYEKKPETWFEEKN